MKCPKCGYNSFEFLDTCKKCGSELETLKKTYRITPLVLSPGERASTETRQTVSSIAAEMPVLDTGGPGPEKVIEEFSWDAPDGSTVDETAQAYSGFDLNFSDSDKSGQTDGNDSVFSFTEEAASPASGLVHPGDEGDVFDFAALETVADEQANPPREFVSEERGSGLEDYERMLEPESLQDSGPSADSSEAGVFQESETFGMPDFSFETEPAAEVVTGSEGEDRTSVSTEKKPQPNLENFEKEFEKIFAAEESVDK